MRLRFASIQWVRENLISISVLLSGVGCAGPTTPFGAQTELSGHVATSSIASEVEKEEQNVTVVKKPKVQELEVTNTDAKNVAVTKPPTLLKKTQSLLLGSGAKPAISFSPDRQVLHGKTDFVITINDTLGIPNNPDVTLLYNGYDLTSRFMSQAEVWYAPARRSMTIRFPNLRLLSDRDNKVEVVYRHSKHDGYVFSRYLPPVCEVFNDDPAVNIEGFKLSPHMIKSIHKLSLTQKVNPSFMTGLIAQESAFDYRAVSWAKAIGLTQVTSVAEQEILKTYSDWPRYENIRDLPAPMVKALILSGKINANNEWRLDPQLSIQGGLTYIKLLSAYWRKPENFAKIAAVFKDPEEGFTQIILASYNSGFSRVGNAMVRRGSNWIRDTELKEARRYVNRVMSYCYHFSRSGDDDEDPT